ncbi:MAG TPA: hypothetical protein VK169_01330 [Saprospiraceae bacterium]|nr:hypothetical protein [Saprospiraceae bacterium]
MNGQFKYFSFAIFLILLFPSCSKVYFDTQQQTSTLDNAKNISSHEVSIGEWITYIVTTSFIENEKPIYLGDHLDIIKSKLPLSGMGHWNDYVFESLIKKSQLSSQTKVYNHCTNKHFKIILPKSAWDSIVTNKLLELPIVGISYEQVLDYLAYKKDILNNCKIKGDKTNETFEFDCYLPLPTDYDDFVKNNDLKWVTKADSINAKGCSIYNYKNSLCENCPIPKYYLTNPVLKNMGQAPTYVWGFFPIGGLYNLFGNVAEMTSIKGIAKGGSYYHHASEIREHKVQRYTNPEPWLGFRVWFRTYPK